MYVCLLGVWRRVRKRVRAHTHTHHILQHATAPRTRQFAAHSAISNILGGAKSPASSSPNQMGAAHFVRMKARWTRASKCLITKPVGHRNAQMNNISLSNMCADFGRNLIRRRPLLGYRWWWWRWRWRCTTDDTHARTHVAANIALFTLSLGAGAAVERIASTERANNAIRSDVKRREMRDVFSACRRRCHHYHYHHRTLMSQRRIE